MKIAARREYEKELFKTIDVKAYNVQYLDTSAYRRSKLLNYWILSSWEN